MNFKVIVNILLGKEPSFRSVKRIVCMGSGPQGEIARMVEGCARLFPQAEILLLCDPSCHVNGVKEKIGLDTLARNRKEIFRSLRGAGVDLGAVLVNGDLRYWRQWVQVLFVGTPFILVFNENGDCFFPKALKAGQLLGVFFSGRRGGGWGGFLSWFGRSVGSLFGLAALAVYAGIKVIKKKEMLPAFALPYPGTLFSVGERCEGFEDGRASRRKGEGDGERFHPGQNDDLEMEHRARYAFVLDAAFGSRVLDVGCGEGYGPAFLASVAERVVAFDLSKEIIEKAKKKYSLPNLEFLCLDAQKKFPFGDASFDLVVSFEMIEHLERWGDFLGEVRRVLKPSGLFALSTPNKLYYRTERGEKNPFHLHEFELEELKGALSRHFEEVHVFGENHVRGILVDSMKNDLARIQSKTAKTGRELETSHYFVVLCGAAGLEEPPGALFLDVRGNQMREREREIHLLRREIERARAAYKKLEKEFQERSRWALSLKEENEALIERLRKLESENR